LKQSLIDALKGYEDGYLWTIINSLKPLWLIGNQGSGKTYTAGAIALIRKYCLDAPIYYLIDRHATGDNAEVWKFLQAKNIAESEENIASTMQDNIIFWGNRIKAKPNDKLQVIIDEFTNLRGLIGELADTWFKLSLTDTRKAKCYLLGITHNDTNSSFAEGTKDTRKAGMILIQKYSANGETPLPRVVIRYGLVDGDGNNLEDVEKTLPAWFHPQKIHDHFNGKPIIF
ncbi:MAG: ATP-binding protein, partial [Dolichospermum sp.]